VASHPVNDAHFRLNRDVELADGVVAHVASDGWDLT